MFCDFVASNWEDSSVLGLSALERALDKQEPDKDYITQGSEQFGYVVLEDGTRSPDLTLPIRKLLADPHVTVTSSVRAMQIEQALYGECRGGHSLLASSGDDAVSTGIVQRLDLPDTAPPGVEWSPFLRGFPYEDRYVLSRTFHDTGASRGGMVFSHALLASPG